MNMSALPAIATNVVVVDTESRDAAKSTTRPAHHLNANGTRFMNPWDSFRAQSPYAWARYFLHTHPFNAPSAGADLSPQLPIQKPTWGVGADASRIKATWLGHACFVIEFPTPAGAARGFRTIFDPALSHRCSPFQWLGPSRLTEAPSIAQDVPAIDAIVLSHNHFDHTDSISLTVLYKAYHPQIFAPLGNAPYLLSLGIPMTDIHILDWWDSRLVSLSLPAATPGADPVPAKFKVTCTPSQHTSGRSGYDRWHTLWASWAVEEMPGAAGPGMKVYFAGDTGYRTVHEKEDEDKVPVCPAFQEIGARFGEFDLALLPIGAYAPRWMWSNLHASPADSVRIFRDVRAKKALAMHWGTWVLTTEPIMEPPMLLEKACKDAGLQKDDFTICGLGETRVV